MNYLGKIFTVVVFTLSLFFAITAVMVYATHKNWYEHVNTPRSEAGVGKPLGLRYVLEDLRAENQRLQDQRNALQEQLATEQAARREQVAKLETERQTLEDERDGLQQNEAALTAQRNQAVATMEATQQTLATLRGEVDGLRQEIREAQTARDEAFNEAVVLTDRLHQSERDRAALDTKNADLTADNERLKDVVVRGGLDPFDTTTPPRVDGIVLAKGGDNLVEISLGHDDGLRQGHLLEVYREDRYLGRVEVVRTEPDKAVAKIIPEFLKGSIQRSDRVATRID